MPPPGKQGAFYRGWRLTAIDDTSFDLPGTKENVETFGRPPRSGRDGQNVGYAQICMVGLVVCGSAPTASSTFGIGVLCDWPCRGASLSPRSVTCRGYGLSGQCHEIGVRIVPHVLYAVRQQDDALRLECLDGALVVCD
ncbi:hypothetical protein GCM10010243_27760 [Streptomyces matensis]|nr:hypothetical protein GCM10010243_27760 [Streptomyces matensis]